MLLSQSGSVGVQVTFPLLIIVSVGFNLWIDPLFLWLITWLSGLSLVLWLLLVCKLVFVAVRQFGFVAYKSIDSFDPLLQLHKPN